MENLIYRYEIRIGEKEKKIIDNLKADGVNTSQLLRDYILILAEGERPEQPQAEKKNQAKTFKKIRAIKEKIMRFKNELSTISSNLESAIHERAIRTSRYPENIKAIQDVQYSIDLLTARKNGIRKRIRELEKELKEVWKTPKVSGAKREFREFSLTRES